MTSSSSPNPPPPPHSGSASRAALLALLQSAQNSDGGWPFYSGGVSRVEPTSWVLRALLDSASSPSQKIASGLAFLKSAQLPDGSWPATEGLPAGGWVTSLACSLLAAAQPSAETQKQIAAGLQWLCDDYPRDSSGWQKFIKKFQSREIVAHNDEFRGWGWTPRTSSWVEPTSFALLAFADAAPFLAPQLRNSVNDRAKLATGLLYDRMCPRGGWNCGNPRVYGVDGDPLVLPTCWALLALRPTANSAPDHPSRALSLAWLQSAFPEIQSPASLALARITLEVYALPLPPSPQHALTSASPNDLAGQGTHVAAWVALALNPSRTWPRP